MIMNIVPNSGLDPVYLTPLPDPVTPVTPRLPLYHYWRGGATLVNGVTPARALEDAVKFDGASRLPT